MTEPTPFVETDESLRTRIANKYGMWGAFLSHVIEAKGAALDECAEHVGLKRESGLDAALQEIARLKGKLIIECEAHERTRKERDRSYKAHVEDLQAWQAATAIGATVDSPFPINLARPEDLAGMMQQYVQQKAVLDHLEDERNVAVDRAKHAEETLRLERQAYEQELDDVKETDDDYAKGLQKELDESKGVAEAAWEVAQHHDRVLDRIADALGFAPGSDNRNALIAKIEWYRKRAESAELKCSPEDIKALRLLRKHHPMWFREDSDGCGTWEGRSKAILNRLIGDA